MPAARAARSARASAAPASVVRSRCSAMPATTSSCAARNAGANDAGSSSSRTFSASSTRPINSSRRARRSSAWAAFAWSPCCSSVERAASSAVAGQREIARHERDLGFGDYAARPRHRFSRAERPRRAPQQRLRSRELAELRHRDAAQRERGWIVAQCDALQRAERITRGERARRRRDQRVHRNPDTLVTPAVRDSATNLPHGRRLHAAPKRGAATTRALNPHLKE